MAWTIGPERTWSNLSSEKHTTLSFEAGEVGCITVTFAYSGTVRVYTDGSLINTVGYLSTSPNLHTISGKPMSSILASGNDDVKDGNFDFTCDVDAGTTYYIWYRYYSDAVYGTIPLHIIPPTEEDLYIPDNSDTELVVTADNAYITARIEGLDADYDGEWRVIWYVYTETDGNTEYILDGYQIDSGDNDVLGSFDDITLSPEEGIQPNTTYTVFAWINYYPDTDYQGLLGFYNKTVTTGVIENSRPEDFEWEYAKIQGKEIKITATEWTALQDNINAVRNWKGKSDYNFTSVSPGDDITADVYNECINAINTIYSSSLTDYTVVANETMITAEIIDNLRIFINQVE